MFQFWISNDPKEMPQAEKTADLTPLFISGVLFLHYAFTLTFSVFILTCERACATFFIKWVFELSVIEKLTEFKSKTCFLQLDPKSVEKPNIGYFYNTNFTNSWRCVLMAHLIYGEFRGTWKRSNTVFLSFAGLKRTANQIFRIETIRTN